MIIAQFISKMGSIGFKRTEITDNLFFDLENYIPMMCFRILLLLI